METPLIVVLAVVAAIALYLIFSFNLLVRLRNRIDAAWSQIDVQLKRRYDLIPNLVETVKGYAAHERETLEAVIQARTRAIDASGVQDQAAAENMLTQAIGKLFALQEAYPNLKADARFAALQEELTGTESRIAYARQFYNEQVLAYDNATEMFPTNVMAGMFGFGPRAYFEIETPAREPVRVDFDRGSKPA